MFPLFFSVHSKNWKSGVRITRTSVYLGDIMSGAIFPWRLMHLLYLMEKGKDKFLRSVITSSVRENNLKDASNDKDQ